MAENDDLSDDAEDEASDEDAQEGPPKRRLSGRALVLFVIAPLLAIAAVGGVAHLAGLFGSSAGDGMVEAPVEPSVFYDLPGMLVNLATIGDNRPQFLKVQISIELPGKEALEAFEPVEPRVIDLFQVYLREMRATDLEGSAGVYRLKEELERRINMEIHPFNVSDVLFREIIVQ